MKSKPNKRKFKLDWVLLGEIAIGPAPKKYDDIEKLKLEGIKSVLSLCSKEEVEMPSEIEEDFLSDPSSKLNKLLKK